ncbi:MAG: hypothetical protein QNK37_14200 [Acidobacteriota bacterium]|nr:hypothetical protein [Acidobacteriota bacterium]
MTIRRPSPGWSRDDLLNQPGMFALKDVAGLLQVSSTAIKKRATEVVNSGDCMWETMGVRKILTRWVILMPVFAGYYREYMLPKHRPMPVEWTAEVLLKQSGTFRLADVCEKLGLNLNSLRYKIKKETERAGALKDVGGQYVVDLTTFLTWLADKKLYPG